MPTTPLSFDQRLADDKAWFVKNPNRSFRVQVVSDAEIQHFVATRDPNNGAITGKYSPPGPSKRRGIIVSFWRFVSDNMKVLDHVILPRAPKAMVSAALKSRKSDAFAYGLFFRWNIPLIRNAVRPEDIVIRSRADITTINLAA